MPNEDDTIARYDGIGWRTGHCLIGQCGYTAEGTSYDDARAMLAEHRQAQHTRGAKPPATTEPRRLL